MVVASRSLPDTECVRVVDLLWGAIRSSQNFLPGPYLPPLTQNLAGVPRIFSECQTKKLGCGFSSRVPYLSVLHDRGPSA